MWPRIELLKVVTWPVMACRRSALAHGLVDDPAGRLALPAVLELGDQGTEDFDE
jgi:hypothetical protein